MNVAGPDQAAGWVIALACFFINFILAGLARSAGVLYVALIELYGASREAASSPFSIRVCVRNMSGPLIGLLGQKYGIRKVTTLGGFVAGLGSILCYFAPNITYITLFWGIIHGVGFGLSSVIHMMIIGQYFDKYKASALGLGYSGDCFGSFAFPSIIELLLKNYDIKGTFLILGGIVLNVVPMAMILKKPPWLESDKKKGTFQRNILDQQEFHVEIVSSDKNGLCDKGIPNEAFESSNEGLCETAGGEEDVTSIHSNNAVPFQNPSRVYRPSLSSYSSLRSQCIRKKTSDSSDSCQENTERRGSLPPLFEKEAFSVNHQQQKEPESIIQEEDEKGDGRKSRTTSNLSQLAYDIVHRVRTASFASQCTQDGYVPAINNADCTRDNTDELTLKQQPIDEKPPEEENMLKTLMRTNAKPIFVLISMSLAVYVFLFIGVFTVIIDYATDYGISQDEGKYLIIGFSVTDLIGRLSFGQVVDRKLLKTKNYAGMTMVLMGASMAIMPFNRSFYFMMTCMCVCGLIQGGTAIMFPILVTEYMEKNEESIAMGCLNFYGGLLMLPLSSMIGKYIYYYFLNFT
ncbi:monocarboxylate transporter 9-like [Parasteatoda tepidariorum]|uniref:monocarboxylate transporter 9-like n=1 Tax=Parasteatoda tepidariorum TaxID=114398 RepID=UPI001C71AF1A|nr:monocarboxylate transporter 12-like [Parasteatoda tepidariorum]